MNAVPLPPKINTKNMTYNFEPHTDYKPRRVWLNKFSHKPSPLKMIFTVALIIAGLLLLGHLSLKAVDSGNIARCKNWFKTNQDYKAKGYVVANSVEDIQLCEQYNINLK